MEAVLLSFDNITHLPPTLMHLRVMCEANLLIRECTGDRTIESLLKLVQRIKQSNLEKITVAVTLPSPLIYMDSTVNRTTENFKMYQTLEARLQASTAEAGIELDIGFTPPFQKYLNELVDEIELIRQEDSYSLFW